MTFDADHIIGLDIETDNSEGHGLDPRHAAITSVAIATADPERDIVFDGDEEWILRHVDGWFRCEPQSLIVTWNGAFFDLPFLYTRARRYTDSFGHDSRYFGLRLTHADGLVPKYDPIGGHGPGEPGLDGAMGHSGGYSATWQCNLRNYPHSHLDVSFGYRQDAADNGVSWSLKPIAKSLGLDPVVLDASKLHEYTPEQVHDYNLSDSRVTRELAIRLLGV